MSAFVKILKLPVRIKWDNRLRCFRYMQLKPISALARRSDKIAVSIARRTKCRHKQIWIESNERDMKMVNLIMQIALN